MFVDRSVQAAGSGEVATLLENGDVHSPGRTWFLQAGSSGSQTQGDLQIDRRHGSCAHATIFSSGELRLLRFSREHDPKKNLDSNSFYSLNVTKRKACFFFAFATSPLPYIFCKFLYPTRIM